MSIIVEFFGIPKNRAGVSQIVVCEAADRVTLSQVIAEVAARLPGFDQSCVLDGRTLRDGYIANIDGGRFVNGNEDALICSGQSVLILSADAGG